MYCQQSDDNAGCGRSGSRRNPETCDGTIRGAPRPVGLADYLLRLADALRTAPPAALTGIRGSLEMEGVMNSMPP